MNTSFRSGSSSMSLSSMSKGSRRGSAYGGAGGSSVRVSRASSSLGAGFDLSAALGRGGGGGGSGGNFVVEVSEKATMQNLNDRLATYLEKVHSLESANAKLELQIREWCQKQTISVTDYSKFEAVTQDLRMKIGVATRDNAMLLLQIDNAKLAADDFKIKFESEMEARMSVETDIAGLRKALDDLTMARSDLEMQVEGLREELVYLKKNHSEEIAALRGVVTSNSVNVEVDAGPQVDLSRIIADIRSQYEGITDKNRRDMEVWYKAKFEELNKQVVTSTETLQTSRSEISELKRTLQSLQIELQSQLSLKSALESQLSETESRYSMQMSQLQVTVNTLENELSRMIADIERQSMAYQVLLDIKTRLELEIAEYRRLLDGGDIWKSVTNVETVQVKEVVHEVVQEAVQEVVQEEVQEEVHEEVQEEVQVVVEEVVKHQPVITQRRRVVIEEIVDGVVVSRTENVDTEVISK